MTRVVDLHPEELLDRGGRGELSASERARLDAHLARCPACRFEQQLRGDFAEELASDVTPSSVERLTLAGSSQPRAASPAPLPRRAPRRRVSRATWLLAAAAVFAVSVAGATGAGQRAWSRLVGPPSPSASPLVETIAAHPAAKSASRHRAASTSGAASSASSPAPPAQVPATIDVLTQSDAPAPTPRHAARSADHAASLFDAANDARRHGDYARAVTLQRELQVRYPRSRESHVSRATMGRLLLDRGDPAGALASFDEYLAGGSGELGEESMVGRATALERLGRTSQAAGAWQALLAAYPETPYAAHAKSRLGSLSVR